ncbi:MAG TPA: BPSS1780 family membrane protein, partial [Gallionella sp.]|nr:BPSS1780 family membrane protein [Gallionella sp.]
MEPQRLSSGHGLQWIKQGYAIFMKAPLLWIVLLLICFISVAGVSAVPVVGEPLASLLLPALLVGLMAGCRALEQGDDLELAHLFSGFQQHTAQLITLGGIALVAQLLIFGLL